MKVHFSIYPSESQPSTILKMKQPLTVSQVGWFVNSF